MKGESQETGSGNEESGRRTSEGMGTDIAFGGMAAAGVRADPRDAFQRCTADLPTRRVEFEADGTTEFIEGEIHGAGVITGGGGRLGDIAPAGRAWRALEVFFAQGE